MESVLVHPLFRKALEIGIQRVANEARIVFNFTEDYEWLKNQIVRTNDFLNEAAEKHSREKESVKEWHHRVRDFVWEAEDIVQICAVDSMYSSHTNPELCHPRIFCYLWDQLSLRRQMGRRIQKVKARLSSVIAEGKQLNIGPAVVPQIEEPESSNTSLRRKYTRLSFLPSDSKPVAIQSKVESVVSLLDNPQIPIIAVVGMGGMGKTYLLQHVYNAQKGRYEKFAWLSVSQFYSLSKLQRDLAFQLDGGLSGTIKECGISEEAAAEAIHRFIQEKKCLIVLDDVWRATREGGLLTKLGIPTGANSQCKVLVSTRSREVCINFNAKIYEMESLTYEESWKLFCAHAFPGSPGNRAPEHLKEVAVDITNKCANLPLAIKTTAASLANNARSAEWRSKLSKLRKVDSLHDPIMDIVKLSYDCLPEHLKACFAYLSFFPEDEQIDCDYLIHLWMGEGFIPAGENPWECLDQLANLCLVEVWETEFHLAKLCKVHDLLLDLAILISRNNKCAFTVDEAFCKSQLLNTGGGPCRRLFLAKKDINEHGISKRRPVSPRLVRTLSLSRNTQIGGNIPAMLFSGMRVLRVLDLSCTNISTLPACVGDMKLLQVLNLRETKIERVPECVRHLKSLSYLNVSACSEFRQSQAPKWIGMLRCLQHLEGKFSRMPKGIAKLESFRTLRSECRLSLSIEEDGVLSLEDLGEMRQIEEIGFTVKDESQLSKVIEGGILAPLEKMRRLSILNATVYQNENNELQNEVVARVYDQNSGAWDPWLLAELDLPELPESMSAMRDLEHLRLDYFAPSNWICCMANLRYLFLWGCDCSDYPELQGMPNLVSLWLEMNASCREFPKAFGMPGGFPLLRFFFIRSFSELVAFPEIEDGGMACLENLEIRECRNLRKWGGGLERRPRLILSIEKFTDELKAAFNEGPGA